MPSTNKRSTSVFFGGKTALYMTRAALVAGHSMSPSSIRTLPASVPSQAAVAAALERAQVELPGMQVQEAAQVLVGTRSRPHSNSVFAPSVCTATLPSGAFWRLASGVYVATPALCFVRAATRGSSDIALVELGCELCGTYATACTGTGDAFDVTPVATLGELRAFAQRCTNVGGARRAARLLRYVVEGSASPRETKLALVLGLPHRYGGFGLGMPCMNYEVEASREASLIAQRRSFRCDLCWPQALLDVEYQSRAIHGNEASRIADSRRVNALHAMGWNVVGVTNEELDSMASLEVIAKTVAKHLGKRIRVRVEGYHERQLSLRAGLGLQIDTWSLH